MKKLILFILVSISAGHVYAQNFLNYKDQIRIGFDKIRYEYPYVVIQNKGSGGEWVNASKFSWAESNVPGERAYDNIDNWVNGKWLTVKILTDSFVLNSDGTIKTLFETDGYNYPQFTQIRKFRYNFSYNTDKTINAVRIDLSDNGINYRNYLYIKRNYANGKLSYDSTSYYQSQYSVNEYQQYTATGKKAGSIALSNYTGDTAWKTFYSYDQHENILSVYSESYNTSADEWSVQSADSFWYEANRMTSAVRYGFGSVNGGPVEFQPFVKEIYSYNGEGMLETIVQMNWGNDEWVNRWKYTLNYQSGRITSGNRFAPLANGTFETEASERILFSFLSGSNKIVNNDLPLSLYPNPVQNVLHATTDGSSNGLAEVTVTDISGRTVWTGSFDAGVEIAKDFSAFEEGFYFFQLSIGGASTVRKFVVKR